MTVLEILKSASQMLAIDEELSPYFNEDDLSTPSNQAQADIEKLLKALNAVTQEIAIKFLPLKCYENINFVNCNFDFDDLTNQVNRVVRVFNPNGSRIPFLADSQGIYCNYNGPAKLEYYYLPENITEEDEEYPYFENKIMLQTLACGVVAEFLLITGAKIDGMFYRKKFVEDMTEISPRPVGNFLPSRKWR